MIEQPDRFCWLDVVTGGLHEDAALLEVGLIVTDSDLQPLAAFHALVDQQIETLTMNEWSWQQHNARGLLDEIRQNRLQAVVRTSHTCESNFFGRLPGYQASLMTLPWVTQSVAQFIESFCYRATLAGNRVEHDRKVMERYCPGALAGLHCRTLDMVTFREALRRWSPLAPPDREEQHRVFADLHASIETARVVAALFRHASADAFFQRGAPAFEVTLPSEPGELVPLTAGPLPPSREAIGTVATRTAVVCQRLARRYADALDEIRRDVEEIQREGVCDMPSVLTEIVALTEITDASIYAKRFGSDDTQDRDDVVLVVTHDPSEMVSEWHHRPVKNGRRIHEFMGWTWDEYKHWAETTKTPDWPSLHHRMLFESDALVCSLTGKPCQFEGGPEDGKCFYGCELVEQEREASRAPLSVEFRNAEQVDGSVAFQMTLEADSHESFEAMRTLLAGGQGEIEDPEPSQESSWPKNLDDDDIPF